MKRGTHAHGRPSVNLRLAPSHIPASPVFRRSSGASQLCQTGETSATIPSLQSKPAAHPLQASPAVASGQTVAATGQIPYCKVARPPAATVMTRSCSLRPRRRAASETPLDSLPLQVHFEAFSAESLVASRLKRGSRSSGRRRRQNPPQRKLQRPLAKCRRPDAATTWIIAFRYMCDVLACTEIYNRSSMERDAWIA